MKKIDLGQTLSMLANIGVIAGIVFLAFEIQQNNELLVDEARRARSNTVENQWVLLAESGDLATILAKDINGESLSQVEEIRLLAFAMRNLTSMQLAYQELPDGELGYLISRATSNFDSVPVFRRVWERERLTFDRDFVDWMEGNVIGRE